MSQRDSGYKRKKNDSYATPDWVTKALVPHLKARVPLPSLIWEPACGKGKMVRVLRTHGFGVRGTDVTKGQDFLKLSKFPSARHCNAIVTNPPYGKGDRFIEHALDLMEPNHGVVAMLLRVDFDSAKTRQHLFWEHQAWSKKIVLTRRIIWFAKKGAAPSYNHAWYIWDWLHRGPPTIDYYVE